MILTTADDSKKLAYSIDEIHEETSLSVPYIRKEIKEGKLKARRFGRRLLVLDADLRSYLEREPVGAAAA
jgi:excisionase family DNA binding protein